MNAMNWDAGLAVATGNDSQLLWSKEVDSLDQACDDLKIDIRNADTTPPDQAININLSKQFVSFVN